MTTIRPGSPQSIHRTLQTEGAQPVRGQTTAKAPKPAQVAESFTTKSDPKLAQGLAPAALPATAAKNAPGGLLGEVAKNFAAACLSTLERAGIPEAKRTVFAEQMLSAITERTSGGVNMQQLDSLLTDVRATVSKAVLSKDERLQLKSTLSLEAAGVDQLVQVDSVPGQTISLQSHWDNYLIDHMPYPIHYQEGVGTNHSVERNASSFVVGDTLYTPPPPPGSFTNANPLPSPWAAEEAQLLSAYPPPVSQEQKDFVRLRVWGEVAKAAILKHPSVANAMDAMSDAAKNAAGNIR